MRLQRIPDKSTGRRVRRYDPDTGAPKLVNPDTPGEEHEPWPLAGVRILGDPPERLRVSTSFVSNAIAEAWMTHEGHRVVTRPAGTAEAPWLPTANAPGPHVFHHFDSLTFKTVDGDVRYKVIRQPDKYADNAERDPRGDIVAAGTFDDDTPVTDEVYAAGQTRVDWFYELELEG